MRASAAIQFSLKKREVWWYRFATTMPWVRFTVAIEEEPFRRAGRAKTTNSMGRILVLGALVSPI